MAGPEWNRRRFIEASMLTSETSIVVDTHAVGCAGYIGYPFQNEGKKP
jgi:hypothetical protein